MTTRLLCKSIAILLVACLDSAHAIVVNENVFLSNGGNISDVANTIKHANNTLREKSFSRPFYAVGEIPGCTATWLGDDSEGWVYILTAAHCFSYTGIVTSIESEFKSWNGVIIAKGKGFGYVPPQRVNVPTGMGGASTDIAVLKLPRSYELFDAEGHKVLQPVIYDNESELNNTVKYVGYGTWGVGLNQSGSYAPSQGVRRLYGESVINSIFEKEHGLGATYVPSGVTSKWARVAAGDSGSAWWQNFKGLDVIIATTNGGHSVLSTGARVSKYASWIKGVYKNVRLFSNQFLHWGSMDRKGVIGDIYVYDNPYNNDREFFRLTGLGKDERYWYFPTDKSDNDYWNYVGPREWGENDRRGRVGDIFFYDNPYNGEREIFKLKGGGGDGRYWYFPIDKSDSEYWEYMGTDM